MELSKQGVIKTSLTKKILLNNTINFRGDYRVSATNDSIV
ncbi:hypothetical protein FHS77_002780 [Paenochrobactrum gallinarii]|uniref:Uncharacterized protein n=1 Tax=Paenochrobactrum gallinarii TaxID=643673 RepID=A0A841M7T3_9HYPH|nr:hypothetical protein [Paenochrobactrum gallinarii]